MKQSQSKRGCVISPLSADALVRGAGEAHFFGLGFDSTRRGGLPERGPLVRRKLSVSNCKRDVIGVHPTR